jgi:S-adenosylmethionine:tRNA ribosyltransferase-isomerase
MKVGTRARFGEGDYALLVEVLGMHTFGRRTIRMWSPTGRAVTEIVDRIGHMPLPPYIHRDDRPADRERYQTIYASHRGSVAAPTAGLHFTDELLRRLGVRGVERAEVTLHVGYGTFEPVRTEIVEDHRLHPEPFSIDEAAAETIASAQREGRRIVSVGTTTTRTLEAVAAAHGGVVAPESGEASLYIYPGFKFQVAGALVTNFHLPKSSLLLLVCAFAGTELTLAAYRHAIAAGYRFYSYGDAMLII